MKALRGTTKRAVATTGLVMAGVTITLTPPVQAAETATAVETVQAAAPSRFPAGACQFVMTKPTLQKKWTIVVKVYAGKCKKGLPDAVMTLWRSRWYGYQKLKPIASCNRRKKNCVATLRYRCGFDSTYTYKAGVVKNSSPGSNPYQWGPKRRIHCPPYIITRSATSA